MYFSKGKVLSQVRSKNFQFILTFLPSFFCDIFNIYSKENLQRDQIWTMMTKACLDGARSNTGVFFQFELKGRFTSFPVLSLRSVKHRQIGFLMGGDKAQAKAFLYYGVATATRYQQMQINVSLYMKLFLPVYNPPHASSSSPVLLNLMWSLAAIWFV